MKDRPIPAHPTGARKAPLCKGLRVGARPSRSLLAVRAGPPTTTRPPGRNGGFMKRISVVALLLVSLSMPAFAARRDDDSPWRGINPIQRAVRAVTHFITSVLDDSWDISVPKP